MKRVRYISAALDSRLLDANEEYKDLGEAYIIFITETDYFKLGKQVYHIDKVLRENGNIVNDGMHYIYINAAYKSDNELGKLCHDFLTPNPEDMYIKELADLSRRYKTEKEVEEMSAVFEEVKEKGRKEGIQQGMQQGILQTILNLVKQNLLPEDVAAKQLNMSLSEFNKLLMA